MARIYVITRDCGYDGQSFPVLAFGDKETAIRWAKVQSESYEVTEVAVYPDTPIAAWFQISPLVPREEQGE